MTLLIFWKHSQWEGLWPWWESLMSQIEWLIWRLKCLFASLGGGWGSWKWNQVTNNDRPCWALLGKERLPFCPSPPPSTPGRTGKRKNTYWKTECPYLLAKQGGGGRWILLISSLPHMGLDSNCVFRSSPGVISKFSSEFETRFSNNSAHLSTRNQSKPSYILLQNPNFSFLKTYLSRPYFWITVYKMW